AGRDRLFCRTDHGATALAAHPRHRAPPDSRRNRCLDGAGLRNRGRPHAFQAGSELLGAPQGEPVASRRVTRMTVAPAQAKVEERLEQPGVRIRIDTLFKRYGALEVFRDISLDVGDREIVAIVGPSGCGKTTLLRCIDGLIPVDGGEVRVEGQRITEPVAGMAMGVQHFGLFPWETGYDNVSYGLRMAGVPRAEIERRVPYFIAMVGLAGFEKAYPYQMSGGMQQRCGLARALAIEPHVLLMDEPFAAVDAQTREIRQFELLRIWEEGPAPTGFVTHS